MSSVADFRLPHGFRMLTVRGIYLRLSLATAVLLVVALFRSGTPVMVTALAAIGGGILAELVVGLTGDISVRRSGIGNGRVLYYGLLITALAPLGISAPAAAAATATAVLIGLWLPGGPGAYWLHPALVGLVFVPGLSVTPGESVGGTGGIAAVVESSQIYRVLDQYVFDPLSLSITPEWIAALSGMGTGEPASAAAGLLLPLLVAAMIIVGEDVVPWILPVMYIVAFAVTVTLFGGEPLTAAITGNAPIVAVLAVADPGVRPAHRGSIVVFGVLAGILTAVFTVYGGTDLPAVAGLVVAGAFRPLLDHLWSYRWRRER
ncbi:MAG: RnfABCDGE type electron transport complex subunit D [Alkalispirochaeta sp.]